VISWPCHVGDVQQAIDAAEVDERTVLGDVLDHAAHDRAFLERFHELGALFAHAGLDHGAAREHHVVALAVELDDFEFEGLVLVGGQVLDRARVDQGAGQECADAVDQDREAALDLAARRAGDEVAGFEGLLECEPRSEALGGVAREDGVAVAVLDAADGHGDEVAGLDFEFALVVFELFDRHVGFGLQACVDHDVVVLDAHDFGGDDLARAHFGTLQGLFKQLGKRFRHCVFLPSRRVCRRTIAAGWGLETAVVWAWSPVGLNNQQAGALSRGGDLLDRNADQADPNGCASCHQCNTWSTDCSID